MITHQLIQPKSIAVIGGSDDPHKPGGNVIKNLLENGYSGSLYVVNAKRSQVQGLPCYAKTQDLPSVDLAILAVPAPLCPDIALCLCKHKETKALIVFGAGFREESEEGARLEEELKEIAAKYGAALIGPNCIGVMNPYYTGVFTRPIPKFSTSGVDLISGSGATAAFILDSAVRGGMTMHHVFSLGNSAQIGVEETLAYLDGLYRDNSGTKVIMLYLEKLDNPTRFLRHARSLYDKGIRIAAVKAGYSEAGSRAASSHTGAMATSDKAVQALFDKAGVIRCNGRSELIRVAAILVQGLPKGKGIGIATHAGGPAVMLTDMLTTHGIRVPDLDGEAARALQEKLLHGASVKNPIDILATGSPGHLDATLDFLEKDCPQVDAITVICGSPGLGSMEQMYDTIIDRMQRSTKPVYAIFPSEMTVRQEIARFQERGGFYYSDEVDFARAYGKIMNTPVPPATFDAPPVDKKAIREVIDRVSDGYLGPEDVQHLLDAMGLYRPGEAIAHTEEEALRASEELGFPLVMKVIGPLHKTDVGGVCLHIHTHAMVKREFESMMNIPGAQGVLLQEEISGVELFAGVKRYAGYGHLLFCGLGGIFVEILKDVASALCPVSKAEVQRMIESLKGYKLLEGLRSRAGVNIPLFVDAVRRVSALCAVAPEIAEMDINPLIGSEKQVVAVDARIRIEKTDL